MRFLMWLIIFCLSAYAIWQFYAAWRLGEGAASATHKFWESGGEEPGCWSDGEVGRAATDAGMDDGYEMQDEHAPIDAGNDSFVETYSYARQRADTDLSQYDAPPAASAEDSPAVLEIRQLRQDIMAMRSNISMQRDHIDNLERTLRELKEQVETLQVGSHMSPEYNEALVLARKGMEVDAIAERCGISVAEAELVQSLTQQHQSQKTGV